MIKLRNPAEVGKEQKRGEMDMHNKIIMDNPSRVKLKGIILLCLLLCIVFVGCAFAIADINKKNLNGQTITVEGVIESINTEDETIYIVIDGKEYTTSIIKSYYEDEHGEGSFAQFIQGYVGKTVQVTTPQEHVGDVTPWVIGLSCEDNVLFDTDEILQIERAENKVVVLVFTLICVAMVLTIGVLWIVRINTNHTKEFALAEKYAEFYLTRQPTTTNKRKKILPIVAISVVVLSLIVIIVMGILEAPDELAIPTILVIALLYVGVFVAAIVETVSGVRKARDFYAENLPFDFTDISHLKMNAKIKAELQQRLIEERQKFPHSYGDGGNGYDVTFTAEGVVLREPVFEENDVVFDELQPENPPIITLPYDELNFEALAFYYRNEYPMIIVIKSRLEQKDYYPRELVNDLHFILDKNLLNSLETFGVRVENLQYILQNKKQLMAQNCKKAKR